MSAGNSTELEQIQQLRGIVRDVLGARPNVGVVQAVGAGRVAVRLAANGTVIKNVPVMGGVGGLALGERVFLLYFDGGQVVAISEKAASGSAQTTSGGIVSLSIEGVGEHNHDGRYYLKAETDTRLSLKADKSHTHEPTTIHAESGEIGGWTIDSAKIGQAHAHLASAGYIAFGATPPESFGELAGVWLGYTPGAAQAQLSLYADADNFLQWDGSRLKVQAVNFALDADGNLRATGGQVGGWFLSVDQLRSSGGQIELDAALSQVRVGALNPLVIDGAQRLIRSTPFTAGFQGLQLNGQTGNAEFNNVTARGELRTTLFTRGEVSATAGTLFMGKGQESLLEAVTTV